MKKRIIKLFSILVLAALVSSPVFADEAVVTYVKGKVEVLKGDNWIPLKVGDSIKQSDTISTGFQSEAKIKYSGSLMALGALTRITMDQLASGNNTEKVDVYLSTGAVRSKVTHDDDTRVSYKVRSPVAVASVRGTEFLVQDNGKVACFSGAVAVRPNTGNKEAAETESKEEAESEESSEEGSEAEVAQGPATPTTPASEISDEPDDNSVVVGAKQKTTFTKQGVPEKPADTAKKNVNKVKSNISTAAEKEAVSSSGTTPTDTGTGVGSDAPKTGSIQVTITFE